MKPLQKSNASIAPIEPDAVVRDHAEPLIDLSIMLRELPGIVQREKRRILAAVLGSLGLGLLYLLVTDPIYNVGARLLVQHRDTPLQEQDRTVRRGTFLATQAEIINSPAVIRTALASVPPPDDFEGTEDERLQLVLASFGVTPVDRTNVLTLSHWGSDPERAAQVVDATIDSYREFVRETGRAESGALDLLTRKESDLREELTAAESRYREFRERSGLVGQDQRAFDAPQAMLSRMGEQLIKARTDRMALEAQLDAAIDRQRTLTALDPMTAGPGGSAGEGASGVGSGGGAQPMSSGVEADVAKIEEALWQAKMRVSGLLQNYGDAHPDVREARQQVAMWEGRLVRSMDAEKTRIAGELRAARRAEQNVKALYNRELSNTKSLDSQQLEEQQLADEVARIRELHQAMLGKLRQWELSLEAVTQIEGGIDVRTLEEPGLRVEKVWPNPVLVLGPAVFVGLAGGLLLAIIGDRSRPRPL